MAESPEPTVVELISQLARGGVVSDQALVEIERRFAPRMFGFVRKFLPPHECEDALQEIWLRLLKNASELRFETESDFTGWLFQVARNWCVSAVRKTRSHVAEHEHNVPDRQGDQPVQFAYQSDVQACLERLENADRQLMIALYYHQRTYDEMSVQLGATQHVLYTRALRARQRLRTCLQSYQL